VKALPQSEVLKAALVGVREILDEEGATELWAKQIRRVVTAALNQTAKPDPLMAAAIALVKSVEVLDGELRAAREALNAGQIWICIDTPKRLAEARDAIEAAKAAGVTI
jgi:hypothetical protein